MKRIFYLLLLSTITAVSITRGEEGKYKYRFVYAFGNVLDHASSVERLRGIAKTCGEHGINGIMLSGQFDRLEMKSPEYFMRLKEVEKFCNDNDVELIPALMSVAWGDAIYVHDKNMAAGLPVKDALYLVKDAQATLAADPPVGMINGGFENYKGKKIEGFVLGDKAEKLVSIDKKGFKEGRSSLRVEIDDNYPEETPVISQWVTVSPYRCYRVTYWLKMDSHNNRWGVFPLIVRGTDARHLHYALPEWPPDGEWHKVVLGFNSVNYDKVEIAISSPMGNKAKFQVDDISLEEIGLVNVLRRPGTPVTVRGEENGMVYEEGRDYFRIEDPDMNLPFDNAYPHRNYRFDHEGPPVRLMIGSRIAEGERLRVSYFHPMSVYHGQVTLCMSEPKVYELWREKVRLLHQVLAPNKYLLNMDEIRAGNTCAACKARGMTMAQIVGDCVHKQVEIIRSFNPKAEIFIWGDMFDPNHNAGVREGDKYFYVDGNYMGSWNYIPKDLIIINWWRNVAEKSLAHFSGLGFRTMASSAVDPDDAEIWLKTLEKTPGACGMMCASWDNNYEKLGAFGDMVAKYNK